MIYRWGEGNYYLSLLKNSKPNSLAVKSEKNVQGCLGFVGNISISNGRKLVFAVQRQAFFEDIDKIKDHLGRLAENGYDVCLVIDAKDSYKEVKSRRIEYQYTPEEMDKIIDTNEYLKSKGMKQDIRFSEFKFVNREDEFESSWELGKVIRANNEIEKIVDYIKEKKFSPFETMVYIHKYIGDNFSYTDEDTYKNIKKSEETRNIVYAYENSHIVCCGFASLVKAIIDRLDNPNLKCQYETAIVFDKNSNKYYGHAFNSIEICDEKYGIDETCTYREDACWDCKKADFQFACFTHFLQPFQELDSDREYAFRKVDENISNRVGYSPSVYYYGNSKRKYWKELLKGSKQTISIRQLSKAYRVVLSANNKKISKEEIKEGFSKVYRASILRAMFGLERNAINSFVFAANRKGYYNNKEVILEILKNKCEILKDADDDLKKDKEFILEAIKINEDALQYADDSLKQDKTFLLKAIKINSKVAKYIDENLLKDEDFVLSMMKINKYLFEYADESLRKNENFVLKVIKSDYGLFQFADASLKYKESFLLKAIKINQNIFYYIDDDFKEKEFLIEAVKANPLLINRLDEKYDKDFLQEVIKVVPDLLNYVNKMYLKKIEKLLNEIKEIPGENE